MSSGRWRVVWMPRGSLWSAGISLVRLRRVSGILLALAIVPMLALLERSVSGEEGYRQVAALFSAPAGRVLSLLLLWSLLVHGLAGLRQILLDFGIGEGARALRVSARSLNLLGLAGLLLGAWWLL